MTRIAPTLTLLAVAALGGGMFVANALNDPAGTPLPQPTPAAAAAAATPAAAAAAGTTVVDLSELPVVGAPTEAPAGATASVVPAAAPDQRTELDLAGVPVAGAPATGAGAGATPVANPADPTAYAGRTTDGAMSVAVAVRGGQATGYVCDSPRIEAWLTGTVTGDTVTLRSKSGRTVLTGTVTADTVQGSVTVDGAESRFSVPATDVATAAANGRPDVGKVVKRLDAA